MADLQFSISLHGLSFSAEQELKAAENHLAGSFIQGVLSIVGPGALGEKTRIEVHRATPPSGATSVLYAVFERPE